MMDVDDASVEDAIINSKKRKLSHESADGVAGGSYKQSDLDHVRDHSTMGSQLQDGTTPEWKRAKTRGQLSEQPGGINDQNSSLPPLPPEVLQHILAFLDPLTLGRALCVSRSFNALLDPQKALPSTRRHGHLSIQDQDHVWRNSRRLYHRGFPRPLSSVTELQMWSLLRGTKCNFCERRIQKRPPPLATSPWNAGPGPENVRVIWPFAIRSCGSCLQGRLIKESELLFSSISALLPGIPFAYLTPSLNFVTSITLRVTSPPPNLHLTKYYYKPQMEDMKRKLEAVRTLGSAAAEEWYKGLEATGSDAISEAARFEHWEATGGYDSLFRKPANAVPKADTTTERSAGSDMSITANAGASLKAQSVRSNVSSPFHSQLSGNSPRYPSPAPGKGGFSGLPPKPVTAALGPVPNNPFQQGLPPGVSMQSRTPQHRPERNLQDIIHMKAERRHEIERRCLLLSPPIRASTLMYMDAFAAAVQIPMALNDASWDVLKSRLLTQRAEAEQKEAQQKTSGDLLQSQTEGRRQQEEQFLATRQIVNRDWEELQKPVREKLEQYADELIRSQWNNGEYVDKDNAPQFAADVLLYVRKKFYEVLAQEDGLHTPLHLHGQKTPNDPSHGQLKLENMRWIFEAKVKPLTERFRREVFLCSVCDDHRKYYAFDAVIQHYAAKHTSLLSSGTTVVYWKAPWPEESPFDPEPARKSGSRTVEYSAQASSPLYVAYRAQSQPREVHYEPSDLPIDRLAFHPSGTSPHFNTLQSPPVNVAELPAKVQVPPQQSAGYLPATSPHYVNGQQTPHGAHGSYYAATSPQHQWGHQRETVPQLYTVVSNGLHNPFSTSPNAYGAQSQAVPATSNFYQPPAGPSYGIYHVQMEALARIAREAWDGTDGVKDFPSSLRIHVIIHHVALRFSDRFTNEPTLTLFIEALNNNSGMKPLKNLGGLRCKTCALQITEVTPYVEGKPAVDNTDPPYMLSELLKHFQGVHAEAGRLKSVSQAGIEMPRPDWKFDMVQLPDENTIRELMTAPGITYSKLRLVAMVLPQYFPHPIPEIQPVPLDDDSNMKPFLENGSMNPAIVETLHGLFDGSGRLKEFDGRMDTSVDDEQHSALPAEHNEYDPHEPRPSYDFARQPTEVRYVPVYPIQERPNRMRPAYDDRYYEGARSSHVYEVDDGHTRMVLPEGVSLVRRPYESRYRYEDEYLPRAVETVRRQPARYYPVEAIREYSPVRRRLLSDEEDRPSSARQEPAIKSRTSPLPESVNAAEHFLNNFDMVASAENIISDPTTHHRDTAERDQRLRETFPDPVENADEGQGRLLGVQEMTDDVRSHVNSHRGTPKTVIPPTEIRERSRSSSPRFRGAQEQDGEYEPRAPEAPSYPSALREYSGQPRDVPSQSRQRSVVVEEIGGYREPVEACQPMIIEYDQNGLPTGDPHLVRAPVKRVYYRDRSPPQYRRRESYGPHSPPIVRRYPSDNYSRYIDTRPYSNYGYTDERPHVDAPFQYVRVGGPREGTASGNYYVEHPVARDPRAEYVEYNAPPPRREVREVVYERDGRLYARPDPRPQDARFEAPYESVRYR